MDLQKRIVDLRKKICQRRVSVLTDQQKKICQRRVKCVNRSTEKDVKGELSVLTDQQVLVLSLCMCTGCGILLLIKFL